ncbi:MAG: hypothetical protein ACKO1J_15145 [Tagaea sp.]
MSPPDDPIRSDPMPNDIDTLRAEIARRRAEAEAQGAVWPTPEEVARRRAVIRRAQAAIRALPVLSDASADEILGYDENGLPT